MSHLERIPAPRFPDVNLRTPPHWAIAAVLATLGGIHLAIAVLAALHGRWEGYLSFIIAAAFLGGALAVAMFRTEIVIRVSCRQIRRRTGVGRWHIERLIPFDAVSAVRLTFAGADPRQARIEIVCLLEEIECPPTPVPRQEALLLAMMLEVGLVKVHDMETQSPAQSSSSQHVEHE